MSPVSSWSRERTRLLGQEYKIRLGLAIFLMIILLLGRSLISNPASATAAVLLLIATVVVEHFGIKRHRLDSAQRFQLSAVATGVLDLVAVTLLLNGTGGAHSPFFPLYSLCLIFAATFFYGLELALLTVLACSFYISLCFPELGQAVTTWALMARLGTIVLIAWYSYALSTVLHVEKQGNDQLLRHLTEGVLVLDAQSRVIMVNPTFSSMFGLDEAQLEGLRPAEIASLGELLQWAVEDVREDNISVHRSTRAGHFPEADLPALEVTTISCREADTPLGGWVVVVKDLRDQQELAADSESVCERVSPLANLRALSQVLYGLADRLQEEQRWQAMSLIEEQIVAIRALLSNLLGEGQGTGDLEPDLLTVSIEGLFSSTRRLLEIQNPQAEVGVKIDLVQGLPLLHLDRGVIGRFVLSLLKHMHALALPYDLITMRARAEGWQVLMEFELAPDPDGDQRNSSSDRQTWALEAETHLRQTIQGMHALLAECGGHWAIRRLNQHVLQVEVGLPIAGPSTADALLADAPEVVSRAQLSPSTSGRIPTPTINHLNNILGAIRGYAELALASRHEAQIEEALAAAVRMSDQAAEVLDIVSGRMTAADATLPLSGALEAADLPLPGAGNDDDKILIVDDEQSVRELLIQVFEYSDYRAEAVADGESAIEYLLERKPSVAFVDLMMPGVNGVQVLKAARRHRPDMPVVIMSGCGNHATLEALAGEQPSHVLSKPFTIAEIVTLAERLAAKNDVSN